MKKYIMFLASLLLFSSNAFCFSGGFLVSGAEAVDILVKANHWQAFLSGSILAGAWAALKVLPPARFLAVAYARAFLLYVTGIICIILILDEYGVTIVFAFSCMYDIFVVTKDFLHDIVDYL